jgi:hypothetical protein
MNIAYLSDFFPFSGFDARFNSQLFFELNKNNSVNPYTFYDINKSNFNSILNKRKIIIDTYNIDAKEIIDPNNPVSHKSAAKKIIDINPGLFITKFTSHKHNYSISNLVKALKEYEIPSVCIIDDTNPNSHRFFNSMFYKSYITQFDAIFTVSAEIKKQLQNYGTSGIIEIFDYPLFDNLGYNIEKITAKKQLNFDELSKTVLYPIPYEQKPEIGILLNIIDKTPDDMRFIFLIEKPELFELLRNKTNKPGIKHKVYIEYQKLYNSEVTVFFEAADLALLTYKNSYSTGLLSLCFNYNLPVISENHNAGNQIIENVNGGVITGKNNPENFVNEITKYFNSNMNSSYSANIQAYKKNNLFMRLAEQIEETYKKIK